MSESWRPNPETDEIVRNWMKRHGWEITATNYHFHREIYSWRHEAPGHSHTLRITQAALEDHSGAGLEGHLDRLKVAALIEEKPNGILVRRDGVSVGVTVVDPAELSTA